MELNLLSVAGQSVGKVKLPQVLFTADVNQPLLGQAVRVQQMNRRQGTSSTKTRGEVRGSGRKIWRQKGTGRARHGDRYAPIFVGGGRAHGPKPKSWSLKLARRMKRQALISALSLKASQDRIVVVENLVRFEPKTKEMLKLVTAILPQDYETALIVVPKIQTQVYLAARNLASVEVLPVSQLNTLAILRHQWLVLVKDSLDRLIADQPQTDAQALDLEDLGLGRRVLASLTAGGVSTLEDLEKQTNQDLAKIKGIGPKAIEEIQNLKDLKLVRKSQLVRNEA